MFSARLLDKPGFNLGSIGTRYVLEDLRDMILDVSTVGLEREIFVCVDLAEVFSLALGWDPERTDLFTDTNTFRIFSAFHAFKDALGADPRKIFLIPAVRAMEKFLEGIAVRKSRPLEVGDEDKESVLKCLNRLIFLTEHAGFALPAR